MTMSASVVELSPKTQPLLDTSPKCLNYQDRFSIETAQAQYGHVDDVVADWFRNQPTWLRLVSTNSLSRRSVENAVADGFVVGTKVGTWVVVARDDTEIVFSDSMGFMRYWFSFSLCRGKPDTVEASTSVRYLWSRTGGFYFAMVKPMHRRFVKLLLRKTVL